MRHTYAMLPDRDVRKDMAVLLDFDDTICDRRTKQLIPGAVEMVAMLYKQRVPVAIVSNGMHTDPIWADPQYCSSAYQSFCQRLSSLGVDPSRVPFIDVTQEKIRSSLLKPFLRAPYEMQHEISKLLLWMEGASPDASNLFHALPDVARDLFERMGPETQAALSEGYRAFTEDYAERVSVCNKAFLTAVKSRGKPSLVPFAQACRALELDVSSLKTVVMIGDECRDDFGFAKGIKERYPHLGMHFIYQYQHASPESYRAFRDLKEPDKVGVATQKSNRYRSIRSMVCEIGQLTDVEKSEDGCFAGWCQLLCLRESSSQVQR